MGVEGMIVIQFVGFRAGPWNEQSFSKTIKINGVQEGEWGSIICIPALTKRRILKS